MRQRYRLYRRKRGGRYYLQDDVTGKQESLGTSDRATAARLLHSKNEAVKQPAVNLQIARALKWTPLFGPRNAEIKLVFPALEGL
jgi:hypothetical protein